MNLHDYYDDFWKKERWVPVLGDLSPYKVKTINSFLDSQGKKILDLGCGDGRIGGAFVGPYEVYGIDFSEKAVEEARKKGIKAQVGDIASGLPFHDEEFEVVLITDVLEHVFDPLGLLQEAKRVLKKDGALLCFLPNGANILNRLLFLFKGDLVDYTGRLGVLDEAFSFTSHIRMISPRLMKKMLAYLNLKVTREDYWFPPVFETHPFNKFNWLAKAIIGLRLPKIFSNLISIHFFYKCQK